MAPTRILRVLVVSTISLRWAFINYTMVRDAGNPVYGLIALLVLSGVVALIAQQHWSRYFYYVAATLSVLTWMYTVIVAHLNGVAFSSVMAGVFSLLISAVPPVLGVICVILVRGSLGSSERAK